MRAMLRRSTGSLQRTRIWRSVRYRLRVLLRLVLPESWALWLRGEWLTRQIINGAPWIEGEVALLPRFVTSTDVCWDIGANAGMYTVPLARMAASVYAFEPVRHNRRILEKVVDRTGLTNVTISPVALSDRAGTARMSVPVAGFYGGYYLAALDEGGNVETRTDSIDGLIAQGFAAPTFIKCDVEGAEIPVLNGARALIARSHPTWLLETFDDAVWPLMESLGYVALVNTVEGRIYRSPHRVPAARNYWFVPPAVAMRFELS